MKEVNFDSQEDYGYKVVIGDSGLADLGWATYVGHPFIFDGRPGYAALPNAFLIDRAIGVWDPVGRGTRQDVPLSRMSVVSYAHWLANALEWADARGVELLQAEYTSELLAALADFLASALPLANAESGTTAWFALKFGPSTFGVFDAFADEAGRQEIGRASCRERV